MNSTLTSQDLVGKNALVTGASCGIGAAIALELAGGGANVAITHERSADRAAEVIRAVEEKGQRCLAIHAHTADPADVRRSDDGVVETFGGLDILVNNTGIARVGMIAEISLSATNTLWEVNVRAVTLPSQAAIPYLGSGGRRSSTSATAWRARRVRRHHHVFRSPSPRCSPSPAVSPAN